ncbi:hypothetical protein PG984_002175 [Apiospora sp. TS-2023a]
MDLFETRDGTQPEGLDSITQTRTPNKNSDSSGEPVPDDIIRHPEKVVIEKANRDRTITSTTPIRKRQMMESDVIASTLTNVY